MSVMDTSVPDPCGHTNGWNVGWCEGCDKIMDIHCYHCRKSITMRQARERYSPDRFCDCTDELGREKADV